MWWPVLAAIVVVLVLWWAAGGERDPLDDLPGPPQLPFLGNVHTFIGRPSVDVFLKTRELFREYGDRYVMRIFSRRILVISNPDDTEIVLSNTKNITKSLPYRFLEPWLGTGLLLSTGSKWHKRRKILTPTFHFNILKSFNTIIEEKSRDLVKKLKETRGTEVDLFPIISDFTLYTICETAMGTQLERDKSMAAREYKAAVLEIGHMLLTRLTKFWLRSDFIFNRLPIGRKFKEILSTVHSFPDSVILERKRQQDLDKDGRISLEEDVGSKRKLAMLDLLLEAERKGEIDLEGIREEVNTFMFEGHDTTAAAITFGLMLLADHEDIQERIYEECQSVFGDSNRTPTLADQAQMKYLEAVIKEVLRLYPPVPFIGRMVTDAFQMGDLPIREGSTLMLHIYDLQRRADIFPEPEAFKPERFLSGGPRHTYAYVPFSAGPRNCIGQKFAMQEMKCAFSEIVRHFRLQPKVKGWRPALVNELVLRTADQIHVKFVAR